MHDLTKTKVFKMCIRDSGYPTCYYVTISTGVGGAFIVDGKLVSGGRGHAGEIGNIIVKNNGYKFGALNPGAVEGEASGTAITRKGKELLGEDKVKHAGDVFELASKGDLKAQSMVDECVLQLSLIHICRVVYFLLFNKI